MPIFRLFLLSLCAICVFWGDAAPALSWQTPAPKKVAAAAPKTHYYGAYLQSSKIGYMSTQTTEKSLYRGQPATMSVSRIVMDLRVLGAPATTETTSTTYSHPKTSAPLYQRTVSSAMGRVSDVRVTYQRGSLTYDANIQGTKQKGTLTLKPGEKFLVDAQSGGELKPRIGMKMKGKIFVSDTLSLADAETTVLSKGPIAIDGQTVVAYKVEEKTSFATATLFVSEAGDLLLVDAPLGLQFRRASKAVALAAPDEADRPDIARAIAVTATGPAIAQPRKTTVARYRIGNVSKNLPPDDSIQSATYEGEGNARVAIVTVTTGPLPARTGDAIADAGNTTAFVPAGMPRFANAAAAPANLQPFLKSTLYAGSDSPAFADIARKVVDKGDNLADASRAIAAYVTKTIKPDPSIAALRTAEDVRKDPRGVCRDYTTFFTAIARAAGVPTKQCTGMAYLNGQFYYHAWPEVWIGTDKDGKDIWVALEPTWGAPFADATHIKIAEGEITDVLTVAADIGRYTVEVLEAK